MGTLFTFSLRDAFVQGRFRPLFVYSTDRPFVHPSFHRSIRQTERASERAGERATSWLPSAFGLYSDHGTGAAAATAGATVTAAPVTPSRTLSHKGARQDGHLRKRLTDRPTDRQTVGDARQETKRFWDLGPHAIMRQSLYPREPADG